MRRIAVLTTSRADYGICRPLLKLLEASDEIELCLVVGGTHMCDRYGATIQDIRADGFEVAGTVDCLPRDDRPSSIVNAMGRAMLTCAETLCRIAPDMMVLVGDRFETHAVASAAVPLLIPLLHIHGGEVTEGAMDEAFRHAITKMSHLHCVSTPCHAERVLRMGEEPWRVNVTGAPGLDNVRLMDIPGSAELCSALELPPGQQPLIVTFHPVTLTHGDTEEHISNLLGALDVFDGPIVFTGPNADTESGTISRRITEFVKSHDNARYRVNIGTEMYLALMKHAAAMLGNSSSGIIESPTLGLPVVNVGTRQKGRLRAANVIDTGCDRAEIAAALLRALSSDFREGLAGLTNPYGDGRASERILEVIGKAPGGRKLTIKRFTDTCQSLAA